MDSSRRNAPPDFSGGALSLDHRLRAVDTLISQKKYREAASIVRALQESHSYHTGVWIVGSRLSRLMGALPFSIEQARKALEISPNEEEAHLELSEALLASGDAAGAKKNAKLAISKKTRSQSLDRIGSILTRTGDYAGAHGVYDRLVKKHPKVAGAYHNRATVRRFLGRIADAETDFDQALKLRSNDAEAQLGRSSLRRQTIEQNHIDELEYESSKPNLSWDTQMQLQFALAKELEDLGEWERSFCKLSKGNEIRRKHLAYNVQGDVETINQIIKRFDNSYFCNVETGNDSSAPVFVLGTPRSGTTLIERIIGSHREAEAAGELNAFPTALVTLGSKASRAAGSGKLALVDVSVSLSKEALGDLYLTLAAPWLSGTAYFVDKLPMNYLYVGLIAKALPNAKIVEVVRHPMANCYAMFKTLFKAGYPFSYDFDDLAAYYGAYRRLTSHWRSMLGERVIQVRYEDMVLSQESASKSLIAALGLEWDDACLSFHKNPKPSTTQSAAQVRRPIYTSSLDQWRNYETQLEPLRQRLVDAGIDPLELT